ncbi:MAG: hypothetical protein KA604_01745 [Candidatus Saccharimonas sp.]|nr:hypothetical protein [Candidatus Saccharimonas sp.]
MAEEKQTEMIDDTLNHDDMDVLREVLESEQSRGIEPVSVYNQAQFDSFDDEAI